MREAVRNLLFVAAMLFALSYDACTIGFNYDVKHKIYPEIDYSCTMSISYGGRWYRLGMMLFIPGISLVIAALSIQKARMQVPANLSIIAKEE